MDCKTFFYVPDRIICFSLLLLAAIPAIAQRVLINSHNDYEQAQPL